MAIFEYLKFFLIISLIVYFLYFLSRRGKKSLEPTNWPLIGMLPLLIQILPRLHDYITELLTESGGTFVFKGPLFGNIDMLITSDPANIHHVFSKNFSNYPKGPEFRKIFDILGDGVVGADFELWQIHRKTTLSFLTHPNFSTSLEDIVWKKVETGLVPVLDYFCEQGTDFDLQDIFQRFTFDNMSKLLMDYDPCSLSVELPYVPCEKAFSRVGKPLLHRHVIPESIWKLQKWLKIGGEKKILQAWEAVDEFIYAHVSSLKSIGERENENDFNFLKSYEKVYNEKNIGPCHDLRVFLRDTSLSLLFAGTDTTSACLTWLFWLLATNPSAVMKIREEIESELQLKEEKKWRLFNAEESRKLIYLHGALCESLRLFPPVALEHKAPIRPDVLPSGHRLREDSKVIFSFYTVGRMESVWGKDCLEFKPERWISESGGIKHVPSYMFPAFNAGPRSCLGKEMAFIEMKMAAATIIYYYNVKLVEGHPVSPRVSVVLQAKNGLRVMVSKRSF